MNILDAGWPGAAGTGLVVGAPDGRPALRVPWRRRWRPTAGQARRRPSSRHPPAPGPGRRPARAGGDRVSNQWLGDQAHLALDLAGCFLVVVADGRSLAGRRSGPCRLPLAAMHLFDAESGKALVHGLDARRPPRHEPGRHDRPTPAPRSSRPWRSISRARARQRGRPNRYVDLPGGGVEQDMARTWDDTAAVLRDLADAVPTCAAGRWRSRSPARATAPG